MTSPEEKDDFAFDVLDDTKKQLIHELVAKVEALKSDRDDIAVISFAELYGLITEDERRIVEAVTRINPLEHGFKGQFVVFADAPADVVKVPNQTYVRKSETVTLDAKYITKDAYKAYLALNQRLQQDLGRKLLLDSGYRSAAYQALTWLYYYEFYGFDINKACSVVAIPGYSEHGDPNNLAIDFITKDGVPEDGDIEGFAQTPEYRWLLANANDFGFFMSYPRDNDLGVSFEPWHWRFKKP